MHVIDISCLQRAQATEAHSLIEQVRRIVDQLRTEQKDFRLLWVLDGSDTVKARYEVAALTNEHDFLYLDVKGVSPTLLTPLLARFMVLNNIESWQEIAQAQSLLDKPSLILALDQAGVQYSGRVSQIDAEDKPSLSIVAPYPPVKSGVADYVAAQVAYLKEHYQLVLVRSDDASVGAPDNFPGDVISEAQFTQSPQLQKRVLYHIGNSPAHLQGFRLLDNIPGVVVLHDFFLSDVQQYEDTAILGASVPTYTAMVESHGYQPLLQAASQNKSLNMSAYPCNLNVIERARRVLVHSDYVIRQARHWYGDRIAKRINNVGFAKSVSKQADRLVNKTQLGFAPQDYLVATFGFATPAKSLETIINAWATSNLAHNPQAHLLIVGEFLDERYKTRIERLLALRQNQNIKCLGYVGHQEYLRYLGAVDLAVQLRVQSRGETSAALLDCLAHHVPVIANNHGFVEDLPADAVWKISADPDVSELAAAMDTLHHYPGLADRLTHHAEALLKTANDPAKVAQQLIDHIENTAAHGTYWTKEILAEHVRAIQPPMGLPEQLRLAQAVEANTSAPYLNQILVDITAIARFDLRTGIQRVVRALLWELMSDPPEGYRVEPIYLGHDGVYHYGRQFILHALQMDSARLTDEPISVFAGDIYFGVDLHTTSTVNHAHIYQDWRQRGVKIINVLYDLLPVIAPQWFPADVEPDFSSWVKHIARNSDGVIAISQTVATDLSNWVKEHGIEQQRQAPLDIGWFHLGSDLHASVPSLGLPEDAPQTLSAISQSPSFLMVSTVEPRKGHAQTLAAFESLWAQGHHFNLVIVGKAGWCVENLTCQLRQHPMAGKKLFWLEGISDEYLEQVYPRCSALLAASEGEGFGLPLIEAARHSIPVIARDIPVFREVGGEGAYYFHADTPEQLAQAVIEWHALPLAARPDPAQIKCLSWRDSARQVLRFMNLDFKDEPSTGARA